MTGAVCKPTSGEVDVYNPLDLNSSNDLFITCANYILNKSVGSFDTFPAVWHVQIVVEPLQKVIQAHSL